MDLNKLSLSLAKNIGRPINMSSRQIDFIRFGLELVIGTVIKLVFIFSLARLVHVVKEISIIFTTYAIFRSLSGGVHCGTYGRCLGLGSIVLISLALVTRFFSPLILSPQLLVFTLLSSFLSLTAVLLWAPSAEHLKTDKNILKRKKLKQLSLIFLFIWLVITMALYLFFPLEKTSIYILGSSLGLISQAFYLTPPGYKLIETLDNYLAGIFSRLKSLGAQNKG